MNDTDKTKLDQPLLDDKEFLDLMESEYTKSGAPVDQLAKRRIWTRIIKPRKVIKQGTWFRFAIAAIVLGGLLPIAWQSQQDDGMRIKGEQTLLPVKLNLFQLKEGNELTPYLGKSIAGETIVFKADLSQKAHVALAMSIGKGKPEVRFVSHSLIAGFGQLLERDGRTYAYQLEKRDHQLKFCIIAASDLKELQALLNRLESIWPKLPHQSCEGMGIK